MPVARNCFYWVSIGKNYQEKESFVEFQRDFIETKLRGISQCADCEAEKDDEPVEDALQSRPCRYGNEDLRTDEVKGRAS
ncbi:hypothetical protein WN943_025058 [Citrus x changshan-huyou]